MKSSRKNSAPLKIQLQGAQELFDGLVL